MAGRFGHLVLVVAVGVVLTGCGSQAGKVVGHISWDLTAVSSDGRRLSIAHEIPHCLTEPGKAVVREDEQNVRISVPEVRADVPADVACTADLRIGTESVQLKAPLGRRTLTQPGGKSGPGKSPFGNQDGTPGAKECTRLARLTAGAPARDVPWVADRISFCEAPLPAAARRLAILRRSRAPHDRLPKALRTTISRTDILVRLDAVRRIEPGHQVWLIPGPKSSCIGRVVKGHGFLTDCQPTNLLGQQGTYEPTTCTPRAPRNISLFGLVPAGIDHVRLQPKRGTGRTVPVRSGVWSATKIPYPLEIRYGTVRFTTTYQKRACY